MMAENHNEQLYKKVLLNRVTATPGIIEYIENCLATEDKAAKDYFHKIMIHNWQDGLPQLIDRMSTYFVSILIPVNCKTQGELTSFYTCNLSFVSKVIKFDFMFPYSRNMFSVDVLFNDKSSVDFFDKATSLDEIVSGVVSQRFKENCELDLSNFCKDPVFLNKDIFMYKINQLAHFKILMLRMGRDTKTLNLSNNNLSQPPLEVLNFFIRADLTAMNLSNNNIPSLGELSRFSSKIEKLWLEGNPLCEGMDSITYLRTVTMKFPRLIELDGVQLHKHGMMYPFYRNYLITPNSKTKMVVEKFVTLYFSKYDQAPRSQQNMELLYDDKATLLMSSDLYDSSEYCIKYETFSRNLLDPDKKKSALLNNKTFQGRQSISHLLSILPETIHDRCSFTIDVPIHNATSLFIIVDGIFKEKMSGVHFQFRRSFVLSSYVMNANTLYHIVNEMFSITEATNDQVINSFENPIRDGNSLMLVNPDPDEIESLIKAFQHLTNLKKSEALLRLNAHNWDIREALKKFVSDGSNNVISPDLLMDDDISDISSLLDEIEY